MDFFISQLLSPGTLNYTLPFMFHFNAGMNSRNKIIVNICQFYNTFIQNINTKCHYRWYDSGT
jgi:hypothetical protein